MFNSKINFLVIVILFLLTSCQSNPVKKELSAKEKAVKLTRGDQETSLNLYNHCKEKAKLETFYNTDDARIRAVKIGANTVQIIYATNYNGRIAYDVKFWLCN